MDGLVVRALAPADVPALALIALGAWNVGIGPHVPPAIRSSFRRRIARPRQSSAGEPKGREYAGPGVVYRLRFATKNGTIAARIF